MVALVVVGSTAMCHLVPSACMDQCTLARAIPPSPCFLPLLQMQVSITMGESYVQTSSSKIAFLINFGEKVGHYWHIQLTS